MNLGFDHDGTITEDPEAFQQIIALLRSRGHKVYIVTMRYPSECADIYENWGALVDGIIATSRQAKREATWAQGINIHVWMDDHPQTVHYSAKDVWGTQTAEGEVHIPVHHTESVTVIAIAGN